jgi:hypothetical protein
MGTQQKPLGPDQPGSPLTLVLVVLTFVGWVVCYLIWLRPPINAFLFRFLPAVPNVLHVVLMIALFAVPLAIVLSLTEKKPKVGG